MKHLPGLFRNNRKWALANVEKNPNFYLHLCDIQKPEYLWIGCSDSRVPANEIVGLEPGELFVHRNVANIVPLHDLNAMTVIEFAITKLKIKHIIVCGHYNCSGVKAAIDNNEKGIIGDWLKPIVNLKDRNASELNKHKHGSDKWSRLCELNVIEQVKNLSRLDVVKSTWRTNQYLALHGWIYDLKDGLLRDLHVTMMGD